jgi:hypothetical protein
LNHALPARVAIPTKISRLRDIILEDKYGELGRDERNCISKFGFKIRRGE